MNATIVSAPLAFLAFLLLCSTLASSVLSFSAPSPKPVVNHNRRTALSQLVTATTTTTAALVVLPGLLIASTASPALASIADPEPRAITTVILDSSQSRAGIALYDVTIGTPPQTYPAVRSINVKGVAASAKGLEPGMILIGSYPGGSKSVVNRIKNGPYPIVLQFYNLAAGGDAIGDLGQPIVSAQDALTMAQQVSKEAAAMPVEKEAQLGQKGSGLVLKTVRQPQGPCATKSRRGDVLEINYEARVASPGGPIYDSSAQRGTGQPYQFVLGNGDVIKGVDLGLFDMCPGEIRELDIPAALGFGRMGSKTFDVPGDVRLWWKVELVRMNFISETSNDKKREELYNGGSGEL